MAATLLAGGTSTITNCPDILDVPLMAEVLRGLGATVELDGDAAVILCTVSVHHKTGVEMEALTGAAVAALTIYDMCKALSHDIEISGLRLMAKAGGRRPFARRRARRSA